MDAAAAVLVLIRWSHLLAAVTLVGAATLSLAVLVPSLRAESSTPLERRLRDGLREVVQVSTVVLLLSGAILTFDRLAGGQASTLYAALLAAKIALAVWMFWLGLSIWRSDLLAGGRALTLLVALGAIVLLLAVVLQSVYTSAGAAAL